MVTPFVVTEDNIHILDSYLYRKETFKVVFSYLREYYPTCKVLLNRSNCSMSMEWAVHNLLYNIGIAKARTKDVDLDYPQKWYYKIIYTLLGPIAWLFIA